MTLSFRHFLAVALFGFLFSFQAMAGDIDKEDFEDPLPRQHFLDAPLELDQNQNQPQTFENYASWCARGATAAICIGTFLAFAPSDVSELGHLIPFWLAYL